MKGKGILAAGLLASLGIDLTITEVRAADPPSWAFPINPPGLSPAPDDGVPRHVPESDAAFTLTQVRDLFFAPDWHPDDHPAMPGVVGHGRKPDVMACGSCHRSDGSGGPENANLAGLPGPYIKQQIADYKAGTRSTSVPNRLPDRLMMTIAKAMNEEETNSAAAYFSSLTPRLAVKVVETESVPQTHVIGWFLAAKPDSGTEPIGQRIIEVPENLQQFVNRDGRARFVAYVPPGAVARGRTLAESADGSSVTCVACHGPDLKGLGPVPGLAGRSLSYIVRQLWNYTHGARAGTPEMNDAVKSLALDDMIALAAYSASK